MNNNRFEFKSSLLLVEIIITVFFFALSGIGCIRLYLKAHNLADEARQSTGAVIAAQNLAEAFICAEGDMTQAAQLAADSATAAGAEGSTVSQTGSDSGASTAGAGSGSASDSEIRLYYDSDWMLLENSGGAQYCGVLTNSVNSSDAAAEQPLLHRAAIEVTDIAGNVIYEIPELCVLEGGETP